MSSWFNPKSEKRGSPIQGRGLPELQRRYRGRFSRYLEDRIAALGDQRKDG